MSDHFYLAFENKHRGSRDLIRNRLSFYLPFLAPLKALYEKPAALDLGCGRGEWIELLAEQKFSPRGVDLDPGMLQICREQNLPVSEGEALAYLSSLPDASQTVISAFHLIEHVTFDTLSSIVNESIRVLQPGGLLIMETPNPENLVVGTNNFYLDPSHKNPVPALLLKFITEYAGFSRSKIVRLQESPELAAGKNITLHDVLSGVSPDYAVIAQKTAWEAAEKLFDSLFDKEYGLDLTALSEFYEDQNSKKNKKLSSEIKEVQEIQQKTQAQLAQIEISSRLHEKETQNFISKIQALHDRIGEIEELKNISRLALEKAQLIQDQAHRTDLAVHAMQHSRSWRLTAPFRWFSLQARLLRKHGIGTRFQAAFRKIFKTSEFDQKIHKNFSEQTEAPPLITTPEEKSKPDLRYAAIELMLDAQASLASEATSESIVFLEMK